MLADDDVFDQQVRGRQLRVAVRRARGSGPARTPLLLMNGIGATIEVLQPFVDELPPGRRGDPVRRAGHRRLAATGRARTT